LVSQFLILRASISCSMLSEHLTEGIPFFHVTSACVNTGYLQGFVSSDLESCPNHHTVLDFTTCVTSASWRGRTDIIPVCTWYFEYSCN
jgi:hypothetical protein